MNNLNERNIKKSTLSFLKGYYKNRQREGETKASIDMRGEGGIIADGFLSFKTEEGDNFVSTFEATSLGTKDEVRYKIQGFRLFWDIMAVASLVAATWLGWNYFEDVFFLEKKGYGWVTQRIGAIIGIIFLVLLLLLRRLHRYRYIYAVEQFKQYYANEQWISIGEDVFAGTGDRYLNELKDQCIQNGFGLIKVNEELKPHLLITPARQDTFKQRRRMVQFLQLGEVSKRLKGVDYQKWTNWLKVRKLPFSVFGTSRGLSRFYSSNTAQIFLSGCSWLLIIGIFLYELSKNDIEYVNEGAYPEKILKDYRDSEPETSFDIISDTFLVRDTLRYLDTVRYFREIVYFEKTSLIQPLDRKTLPYIKLLDNESRASRVRSARRRGFDIVLTLDNNTSMVVYSCERFYNLRGPKYIVEEGVYQDLDEVIERVQFLHGKGIDAATIWLGCFSGGQGGYSLYFDLLHNDREEALETMRDYKLELDKLENIERALRIRTLRPVDG